MKRLLFALLLVLVVTAYVQAGFKMFAPGEKCPLQSRNSIVLIFSMIHFLSSPG